MPLTADFTEGVRAGRCTTLYSQAELAYLRIKTQAVLIGRHHAISTFRQLNCWRMMVEDLRPWMRFGRQLVGSLASSLTAYQ